MNFLAGDECGNKKHNAYCFYCFYETQQVYNINLENSKPLLCDTLHCYSHLIMQDESAIFDSSPLLFKTISFSQHQTSYYYIIMEHLKSQYQPPSQDHHNQQKDAIVQKKSPAALGRRQGGQSDSEDIFELEYHTMKKLKLPIHRKISRGIWNIEQNKAYLDFLIKNKESFSSETVRRESRIFCRLSEILHKKRTPDQCRGHHQKLIGKEEQPVDILIDRLMIKIAEAQKQKHLKIKTRMIGKYKKSKMKGGEQQKSDACQVLRVDINAFRKMTTFKNSSRILLQIDEDAIQSYQSCSYS